MAQTRMLDNYFYPIYIFLNGPNPASFWFILILFSHYKDKYDTNLTINDKSVDGVIGNRIRGGL